MLNLLSKVFKSRAFKIMVRIIASLASAIVVISGLLFFMSLGSKDKEDAASIIEDDKDEPDPIP
jgi:hypothetical protein